MSEEINVAKIKLTDTNGKIIERQLQFVKSNLVISDDFIEPIMQEVGIADIKNCSITLGANNIALSVENYTLTDMIWIDSFYNMPSYISILQVKDTNVAIVNQRIELFYADCKTIFLSDCQIAQLYIGFSKHSTALQNKSELDDDTMATHHTMRQVDIKNCYIKTLKAYISCDCMNVQESSIDIFNLYGGFGSDIVADIKSLDIWQYTTIKSSEIYCKITEFKLSSSSIVNLIAQANCRLDKLCLKDSAISNVYGFKKKHFGNLDINTWLLIGKSSENSMDISTKNDAYFHVCKLKYNKETGIRKFCGNLFGLCSGYGYKPFRAIICCIMLVVIVAVILTVKNMICLGLSTISKFGTNLIIALASIAGQSGLEIADGFSFWIVHIEYIISVILFAVFVNALYVRYKD